MKSIAGLGSWAVGLWLGFAATAYCEEFHAEAGAAASSGTASAPSDFCRCEDDLGPSVAHIQRVLSEPLKSTGLDFTEEPLENVINFLQEEYQIPIQIDEPALEDSGITRDEPLTINIQNVSLQSALRLMLKHKGLTYIFRDEVMIITTPEEAEAQLMACIYDVRDLIGRNQGNKNLTALESAITSCVARQTWTVYGGAAEIKPLQPGLLVVAQTRSVHEEIERLLSLIRETMRQPIGESTSAAGTLRHGVSRVGFGGGGYGMGRGGHGMEDGIGMQAEAYGGEMGMQPEPAPAEKDPFGKPE